MFKRTITDEEMALQISDLINKHSNLSTHYCMEQILQDKEHYVVETVGKVVVVCIKIEKQAYALSELKHLVVRPEMRNKGFAKILVSSGLLCSTTPLVYSTVRKENVSSQAVFSSCGFNNVGYYTTGERDLLMFISTSPKWKRHIAAATGFSISYNNHITSGG